MPVQPDICLVNFSSQVADDLRAVLDIFPYLYWACSCVFEMEGDLEDRKLLASFGQRSDKLLSISLEEE